MKATQHCIALKYSTQCKIRDIKMDTLIMVCFVFLRLRVAPLAKLVQDTTDIRRKD